MAKKKDRGWIKLHRQIQDSAIWNLNDPMTRRCAWIDLLLMANHEDRTIIVNGKPKIIRVGQHWTSIKSLENRWGWSKNRVLRFLRLLKELGMITTDGTTSGTMITLIKYEDFQGQGYTGGTTNGTTNGTADGTTNGTADGTQTRTKEELKKNEEERALPRRTNLLNGKRQ